MSDPAFTITSDDLALFTDFYELAMLQSYFKSGYSEDAVFSLFVRRLPQQRNFLLACGLSDVLDYLERLRFSADAIAYLTSLGKFSEPFLEWLSDFRFEGDVYAVPEGTPVFANEPILEVVAPISLGQVIKTLVMNQIHLQTLLASKAARVVEAAAGRPVIDFGARRMHGFDAALRAARAFHIAGVSATSNVLAGERYGVPVTGTMAHSYIEAFDSEYQAFQEFVRCYPDTILLVDTYDTIAGVKNVIRLAEQFGDSFKVKAIRLDSGDLEDLSKKARKLLDAAGLKSVGIVASGGLDEYAITDLVENGAPVTGFGVGTAMGVSQDRPALDIAYKLSAYGGEGRLKLSPGKETYPGRKQIFRIEEDGKVSHDVISRADEDQPGRPLLSPVMKGGKRLPGVPSSIDDIKRFASEQISTLPKSIRSIEPAVEPYAVRISEKLVRDRHQVIVKIKEDSSNGSLP